MAIAVPLSAEELNRLGRMVQKALSGYLAPEMNDQDLERVGMALLGILEEAREQVKLLMIKR